MRELNDKEVATVSGAVTNSWDDSSTIDWMHEICQDLIDYLARKSNPMPELWKI